MTEVHVLFGVCLWISLHLLLGGFCCCDFATCLLLVLVPRREPVLYDWLEHSGKYLKLSYDMV